MVICRGRVCHVALRARVDSILISQEYVFPNLFQTLKAYNSETRADRPILTADLESLF
jgi:hypothetical protein